jgi:hypothetical protein
MKKSLDAILLRRCLLLMHWAATAARAEDVVVGFPSYLPASFARRWRCLPEGKTTLTLWAAARSQSSYYCWVSAVLHHNMTAHFRPRPVVQLLQVCAAAPSARACCSCTDWESGAER